MLRRRYNGRAVINGAARTRVIDDTTELTQLARVDRATPTRRFAGDVSMGPVQRHVYNVYSILYIYSTYT